MTRPQIGRIPDKQSRQLSSIIKLVKINNHTYRLILNFEHSIPLNSISFMVISQFSFVPFRSNRIDSVENKEDNRKYQTLKKEVIGEKEDTGNGAA